MNTFFCVLTLNVLVGFPNRPKSLSPGTGSRSLQNNALIHEWLWTKHLKILCYFVVTSLRIPCSVQRPYHWHGLSKFVSKLPLGSRHDTNSNKPWDTSFIICHIRKFLVDFFIMIISLGLKWPHPVSAFPPMRDLRMQWSRACSLVCQSGPSKMFLRTWALDMKGKKPETRV